MLNRIIRLKNNTTESINISGIILRPNEIYYVNSDQYLSILDDPFIFDHVACDKISVGNENQFFNKKIGWDWLIGNVYPPRTSEGYWTILNKSESEIYESELFSWCSERYIDSMESFSEVMILPSSKTLVIESILLNSREANCFCSLEFYKFFSEDNVTYRVNPNINYWGLRSMEVTVTANETNVINVNFINTVSAENLPINSMYCFTTPSGNKYINNIVSIDVSAQQIVLVSSFNVQIEPGTYITLVDRPIVMLNSERSTTNINFNTPLRFVGDGNSYLKITIINSDNISPTSVGFLVNGYIKQT